MYKKFDVQAYKAKAQENFSGADGDWSGMTDPSMSADGGWGNMTDPSMSADGGHAFANAPEYSFTITNSSTGATNATVTLFGASIFTAPIGVVNYGSTSTVSITPFNNVTYWQMLQDSMVEPFTIGKIRVQCNGNASQVTQNIGVYSTNAQGSIYTEWLNMITTVNQYQFQPTISTWTGDINVTKDVYLQFPMLANATAENATILITVYLKRKVNTARGLSHGSVGSVGYKAPIGGLHPVLAGQGKVGTF